VNILFLEGNDENDQWISSMIHRKCWRVNKGEIRNGTNIHKRRI